MRAIISIVILFFLSSLVYSQTEKLEKENLSVRFSNGDFSATTYKEYAADWRKMIEDIGGYPNLPYDEVNGQINFNLAEITGQSKKVNFNRILEWAAITFGQLNSVLHYKDYESGKIILKGWFNVKHKAEYRNFWGKPKEGMKNTKCFQTYIFTIKDDAIKIEVVDVNYNTKVSGYFIGTVWVEGYMFEYPIHDVYPITNFESNIWVEKLDLLNQTSKSINSYIKSVNNYIKDYKSDYEF